MAGSSAPITPNLTLTNVTPSASMSAAGFYDKTKETTIDIRINKDSGTAGVGYITFKASAGASQLFTASAAIWFVWKFGLETQVGGFLQRADGTAFTVAQLPAAAAAYAGAIAFCSDGVRICKYDGSAWQQLSVAN